MLLELSQKNPNIVAQDMRMKRRLLFILVIIIVIIWFASLKNRGRIGINEAILPAMEIAALKQNLASLSEKCKILETGFDPHLPVIYVITPTYARPVQKAELTRLSHTIRLVKNLHWIIVEDAESPTDLVANLLSTSGITYTHLTAATPKQWKLKGKEQNWMKPRGVLQRNTALQWIRNNLSPEKDSGVIYFADDDNTYSLELFEEMRYTKTVSVWPVGLVGGLMVEKPLLNPNTGLVSGWNSVWSPKRPFPVDMAGFAINLAHFLKHPEAKFSFTVEKGFQESEILRHLATKEQLEPKADNCTRVYVWHTRTEAPNLKEENILIRKGKRSDEGIEV